MIRSILSILGGFFTMAVSVSSLIALLMVIARDQFPETPGPYTGASWVLVVEIFFSLLAALAGGYVCAWIAKRNLVKHAAVLAGIIVCLGVVSVIGEQGMKPLWSSIMVSLMGPIGVLAGARFRAHSLR